MPITKLTPENQPSLSDDRLAALRALLPEAVADGKLNWEAVRDMLAGQLEDEASEAAGKPHDEHFGLFWPGKRAARREAASPAKAGLHPALGEGVDEANTRNLYLEGDNLSVLKLLRKAYSGRVKMIYIDPPYNTGNDFVYKDNFAESSDTYLRRSGQADASGQRLVSNPKAGGRFHSNWLNMIYPRLLLARELLRDDGVIVIHIDEHEESSLQLVLNEIFGEENRLGTIIWDKRNPKGDSKAIAYQHESIHVYGKQKSNLFNLQRPKRNAISILNKARQLSLNRAIRSHAEIETEFKIWLSCQNFSGGELAYSNLDENFEPFQAVSMAWPNKQTAPEDYFSSIIHPITQKTCSIPPRGWRFPSATIKKMLQANKIIFGRDESIQPRQKYLLRENLDEKIASLLYFAGSDDQYFSNENLNFDNPKPLRISQDLVSWFSNNSLHEDIILDFFSGSATTAHAVLAQNQADGGNRRFILVQLPEATDNPQYPTIAEIGKERIRRVITQLRSSAPPPAAAPSVAVAAQTSLALTPAESADPQTTTSPIGDVSTRDLGFKVFKLAPSVFRDWQDYAGSDPNALHDLFSQAETPLRAGWQAAEVLAEVMLLEGFPLDSLCRPAAAFTHNTVFCVQSEVCQHRLFVCLEAQLHPATLQQLAELRRDVFICLDSALSDQAKVRLQDLVTLKVI